MYLTRGVALVVLLAGTQPCRGEDVSAQSTAAPVGTVSRDQLPGAPSFAPETQSKLETAWRARPPGYEPRTRHRNADGTPKYTNRLFLESSPYLLQHAHNPVNWYPWGDEAFETARKLGRPVLLSVGYSTCHWCHVMEEESFEDEEIARYLNEHYVAIKVDREERPDIDAIYMAAVQRLTGGGGWPMTVWLTADRKPFYGGTYFPPRDGERGQGSGFLTVLEKLEDAYRERSGEVAEAADSLAEAVGETLSTTAAAGPANADILRAAAAFHARRYDPENGGARGARKFPSDLPIRFLLRYHRRTGDANALAMATATLEKMAAGGIHDQVGGGFHRYATDARWLVPHFEKMLYDNALLAVAYLEAYQATQRPDFAAVARDVLRWIERDMTSPEGAFYSATDADSLAPSGRREEGRFFTWSESELNDVLGAESARLVVPYFGVKPEGTFGGRNILHVARPLDAAAKDLGIAPESAAASVAAARDELYAARARRPPPLRDEKVLAAWNGLAISALARAGFVFADDHYTAEAARAAQFALARMRPDGRLRRSYRNGRAYGDAYLEDYAFLIGGLLDLYESSAEPHWLAEAIELERVLDDEYWDGQGGAYFLTGRGHEVLLAREKPSSDGAEPSGNSVQALNLLRLAELTTDDRYRQRAERTLGAFALQMQGAPASLPEMLLALDFSLDAAKEIVIAVPGARSQAEPLLAPLRATFAPNRVLAVVGGEAADTARLVPLVADRNARDGKPTAYVCKRRVCDLPTSDPAVFARQIGEVEPLSGRPASNPERPPAGPPQAKARATNQ